MRNLQTLLKSHQAVLPQFSCKQKEESVEKHCRVEKLKSEGTDAKVLQLTLPSWHEDKLGSEYIWKKGIES